MYCAICGHPVWSWRHSPDHPANIGNEDLTHEFQARAKWDCEVLPGIWRSEIAANHKGWFVVATERYLTPDEVDLANLDPNPTVAIDPHLVTSLFGIPIKPTPAIVEVPIGSVPC